MNPWPWRKRNTTEGAAARGAAQQALDQAKAQRPAVKAVADSLRELRVRNHFAESFIASMRRHHP
jgi:hypothetical protein